MRFKRIIIGVILLFFQLHSFAMAAPQEKPPSVSLLVMCVFKFMHKTIRGFTMYHRHLDDESLCCGWFQLNEKNDFRSTPNPNFEKKKKYGGW